MTALVAYKYMPEQMPVEELRATFTAREHTLDFMVKALRDQIRARTLTSYLITGPRGSGKTTLVLMLRLRILEDPELAAAWLPVRFPEELPAITSLRDLFAAALAVMAEDGIDGAHAWHEKVEREADGRRSRDLAVTALRRIAEGRGKRLILFVENFDQLFERTSAKEEATLRRLLMADPFMLIIGTTVRQFEALRDYGRAFFNYFCDVPLKRLDDEQVRALLVSRARWDRRLDVAQRYFAQEANIRAICRLTGGNTRLTVMLYEILSHGDIESVVVTLRHLVDQLTPLLKDVLEHQLTAQQRKVVDALMRVGGTATPRALAGATRLSLNTVTTQLQRLKEAEIVDLQGGGKGHSAYYFVPDRLFRTWYQMRYLRPGPIEFVEMLRTWFNWVKTDPANLGTRLRYGSVLGEQGEYGLAVDCFDEVVQTATDPRVKSAALVFRGFARKKQGDISGAITDYTAVVGLQGALPESVVTALVERSTILKKQGDALGAIADYTALVELEGAPREEVARALLNRGIARGREGDTSGARADYTALVELDGAPPEQVAWAHLLRGISCEGKGDTVGAIADYTAVVDLEGTLPEPVAGALVNRGNIREQQGDARGAIADYTAVVDLKGAPREAMVLALFRRGTARAEQDDPLGAISDYTTALQLKGVPSADVATALFNRGVLRGEYGDASEAIADFTAVTELKGAPREDVVRAFLNRGVLRQDQGDASGAISDFTAVVELEGVGRNAAAALVNRGTVLRLQGDAFGALRDLTAAVDLSETAPEVQTVALVGRAQVHLRLGQLDRTFEDAISAAGSTVGAMPVRVLALIFAGRESRSDQNRVERVCSVAKAVVMSLAPDQRWEVILSLLSGLSSPETGSVWLRLWRTVSRDLPEDALSSLAFLHAVADVLEGRDRSVLNPLPPDQRDLAEEILRKLQPPPDTGPLASRGSNKE